MVDRKYMGEYCLRRNPYRRNGALPLHFDADCLPPSSVAFKENE